MHARKVASVIAAASLAAGVLAGCSPTGGEGRCVDYVSLATPAARYHAAKLVVEAQVTKTNRTITDFSIYPEYHARVLKVLKGTTSGRTLRVISTSSQCETQGQPAKYADGDRLAQQGQLVLYLVPSTAANVWKLVVPGSIDPPAVAGQLPQA